MKRNIQLILTSCAAAAAVAAIVCCLATACTQIRQGACRQLVVNIADKEQRYFITEKEIAATLSQNGLAVAGKDMESISTQQIEDIVRSHETVRTAECYKTQSGDVKIDLTQRVPLLRVTTPAESYFIDTDRKRMPVRAGIDTKVIPVNGHVGLQMAQNEIADFAVWLQENTYWSSRITAIDVKEGKQFVLRQQDGSSVLLGELANYRQKLKRLRIFLEEKEKGAEIPQYKEFDLRYKEQVIGRKKQD